DRRMTDRFEVVPADGQLVEAQHLACGIVDELHPSLRVDDDDALDHAAEDRGHAPAIARQFVDSRAEILDGVVERTCDDAELVVSEIQAGRRQLTFAIATSETGNRFDAATKPA